MDKLSLTTLKDSFSILRLPPEAPIPDWALKSDGFLTISRTSDELSIVAQSSHIPKKDWTIETGWRALKVDGALDFSLTGILAAIANPLAQQSISIFAISTFDTDYILVKEEQLQQAQQTLIQSGMIVS